MDQPAGPAHGAAVLSGPRAARRSGRRGSGSGLCLLTVGHGTMTSQGFIELLRAAAVEGVVDVRSIPGSRRHPQFTLDQLASWLPDVDIGYRWEPRLGGFRRPRPDSPNVALRHASFRAYADHMASPEFAAALAEVVAGTATRQTAAMCAETLWWRCHRRLIADAAVLLHGICVRHLGHDGRLADHRLTDGVRVEEGKLVYDAA